MGKITKVWHHETAERLFCEEIDVGEGSPRPIVSGLRQFYTLEQMEGRNVIVCCNLEKRSMQGFTSLGMVLAAKSADGSVVELVAPPVGSKVGDRISILGLTGEPWPSKKISKNKLLEAVLPELYIDGERRACWQGQVLSTISAQGLGPCLVDTLINSQIS